MDPRRLRALPTHEQGGYANAREPALHPEPSRGLERAATETDNPVVVAMGFRGYFFDAELAPILDAVAGELRRALGTDRVSVAARDADADPNASRVSVSLLCRGHGVQPSCGLGVGCLLQGEPAPEPWPVGFLADVNAPGDPSDFIAAVAHWQQNAPNLRSRHDVVQRSQPFRLLGTELRTGGFNPEVVRSLDSQLNDLRGCLGANATHTLHALLAIDASGRVEELVLDPDVRPLSPLTPQEHACITRHLHDVRLPTITAPDRLSTLLAFGPLH